jgi:hypothetical protein
MDIKHQATIGVRGDDTAEKDLEQGLEREQQIPRLRACENRFFITRTWQQPFISKAT